MHCRIIAFLATIAAGILAAPQVAPAQSNQPAVAILGLEVIDDGAGIDAETAKLAADLTEALRRRATVSGAGPYRLAPNSSKDLLEMKLLSNCTNEARSCMAAIGKELGAEWLMYGKIERRRDGYQVTLKLLNVESKSMEKSTTELIQLDQASKGLITNWAGKLYNRLTGVPDQGSLVLRANVSTGKVYVNNELKGALNSNTLKIDGIASGKHQVRVEAEGHEPLVIDVEIEAGKTANEELQLQMKGVGGNVGGGGALGGGKEDGAERPGGGWRIIFWTSAAATVASAGALTYSALQVQSATSEKDGARDYFLNDDSTRLRAQPLATRDALARDCDPDAPVPLPSADDTNVTASDRANIATWNSACERGAKFAPLSFAFGAATGVTAVITGLAYYKGYISAGDSSQREIAGGRRVKNIAVTITPTVLPNYVGTGVKIEF